MPGALKMRIQWKRTPEEIRATFRSLERGLRDWSPAMVRLRDVVGEMFGDVFSSGGAELGESWAPPSAETLRRRMRNGGTASAATLRATGVLEASLVDDNGRGGIRRIVQPDAGRGLPRFIWGTRVKQAAALQWGSRKKRIPPRKFVGITERGEKQIREVLQETLEQRLAETAVALAGGSR